MSEIFEGIVVPVGEGSALQLSPDVVDELSLVTRTLGSDASVVFRSDPRGSAAFTAAIDEVASEMSRQAGSALVVRFDSRIGHRSSSLYCDGRQVQLFGNQGELFVPLDEKGQPVLSATPIRREDLELDVEYETISNAIQQGLHALGAGSWSELFGLMTR